MSWQLGNPVPLSDALKDLGGDPLLPVTDASTYNVNVEQKRHFQLVTLDTSTVLTGAFGFILRQRFPLVTADVSIVFSEDAGGFVKATATLLHFQLIISDTSFFLVTFKTIRFKVIVSDISLFYYRLSNYIPAPEGCDFITDRFISAIPNSLNFDPKIQAIGLVNDQSINFLTNTSDRVRVLCNID